MTNDGAGFVAKRAPSELQAKIGELCIETGGPFTLSTGEVSNFYFDCKRAVLQGDVLCMIAAELLREANELPEMPDAVGGLSIGADFLVAATIQLPAAQRGSKDVLCMIAAELLREAHELPEMPDAVGGLSIGADFLVAATIQLAAQRGHPDTGVSFVKNAKPMVRETTSRTNNPTAPKSWWWMT